MIGTLETGLGEGGYYISKEGYMKQFNKKLNWQPFKGTFNLRLNDDEVPKIEAMKAAEGILDFSGQLLPSWKYQFLQEQLFQIL